MEFDKDDLKHAQSLTFSAGDSIKSISGNTTLIKVFICYEI